MGKWESAKVGRCDRKGGVSQLYSQILILTSPPSNLPPKVYSLYISLMIFMILNYVLVMMIVSLLRVRISYSPERA